MALQWNPVQVPFGFTQDESTHPFAIQGPILQQLVNGRVYKNGHVKKRPGWQERNIDGNVMMQAISVGGKLMCIQPNIGTSTSNPMRELTLMNTGVFGGNRIDYTLFDKMSGTGRTKSLPEIAIEGRETVWRNMAQDGSSLPQPFSTVPDHGFDPGSNLELIAWVDRRDNGSGTYYLSIMAVVIDATTRLPVNPPQLVSTPGTTNVGKPRVVNQTGFLYVVYEDPSNNALRVIAYNCTTRAWGSDTGVVADLNTTPVWDACDYFNSAGIGWYIAYRTTGPALKLLSMNGTTILTSQTIAEDPTSALCVYADSDQGLVWVAYLLAATGMRVLARNASTIATVVLAPTTFEAVTDNPTQIAMAPTSVTESMLLWSTRATGTLAGANTYGRTLTKYRTVTRTGTLGTQVTRASFELISKAIRSQGGGIYVNVLYDGAMNEDYTVTNGSRSTGFSTCYTMCVNATSAASTGAPEKSFRICGIWALGSAGFTRRYSTLSSLREVEPVSNEFRFCLASGFAAQEFIGNVTESPGVDLCRFTMDDLNYQYQFATTIGPNVVFGGAVPYVFDGKTVSEYGILVPPENAKMVAPGAGGALTAGTYAAQVVWEYRLATGDIVRSAPSQCRAVAPGQTTVLAAANDKLTVTFPSLSLTQKYSDAGSLQSMIQTVKGKVYRTEANGSIYYLETSPNTTSGITGNHPFQTGTNESTDCINSDSIVLGHEVLYTTADILPNYPLPALAHLTTFGNRVFGVMAEDRHQIVFTQTYDPGELPGWHPDLILSMEDEAVALCPLDQNLVILCKNGVYVLSGEGPDRKGLNSNFSVSRLNGPHGCVNAISVAATTDGVIYQARAGLMMLDRKFGVTRIGGPVENTLASFPYVIASAVWPENEWVYWSIGTTPYASRSGGMIAYDWRHKVWAIDRVTTQAEDNSVLEVDIQSLTLHDGSIYGTMSNQASLYLHTDFSDPGGNWIYTQFTTAWLNVGKMQLFQRARWLSLLGEVVGYGTVTVKVRHDYSSANEETFTWSDTEIAALGYENLKHHLANQRATAYQIEVSDTWGNAGSTAGSAFVGLMFDIGFKANVAKLPQIAMK